MQINTEIHSEELISPPKRNKITKKKIIAAVLILMAILLLVNHCYYSGRSDSKQIKDYLKGKEKRTIINPYTGSYDMFFFDNHKNSFGYNSVAFALYSQFSDEFTNRITLEKDILYIETWVVFSNWGEIGDEETSVDVIIRKTEHGSEIAHASYKIKRTDEKEIETNTVYVYVGLAYEYMNEERLETKGHIWAWDLINKTNTYCNGKDLPRAYNRSRF